MRVPFGMVLKINKRVKTTDEPSGVVMISKRVTDEDGF